EADMAGAAGECRRQRLFRFEAADLDVHGSGNAISIGKSRERGSSASAKHEGRWLWSSTPTPISFADHLSPVRRGRGSAGRNAWLPSSTPRMWGRGGARSATEWGMGVSPQAIAYPCEDPKQCE